MLEPGQLQELSLRFTSPALSLLTLTGYFYIFPYVTRSGSALVSTLSEAKGKKPTVNSSNGLPADCFSKCHPGSLPWHLGGNSSSFWGALGNNQHGVSRAAQNLQKESKMALTGLQLHHSCVCWVSDPSLCLPQNHPRTKAPWACYNHSSTKPLGQAGHWALLACAQHLSCPSQHRIHLEMPSHALPMGAGLRALAKGTFAPQGEDFPACQTVPQLLTVAIPKDFA